MNSTIISIVGIIVSLILPISGFAETQCVPLEKLGNYAAILRNKSKPKEIEVAKYFTRRGDPPMGDHAILIADKDVEFPSTIEDYIVEGRKEKRTVKFDDGSKASVPIYRLTKRCQISQTKKIDKEEAESTQQHLNALQRLQKKGTVDLRKKVEGK